MMKVCDKPCKECPFMGTVPRWLGNYESWNEIHQTLMFYERFPCHLTQIDKMDQPTPEKEVVCKGSLIYMKKCGKLPRNPEIKRLMDEQTEEVVASAKAEIVSFMNEAVRRAGLNPAEYKDIIQIGDGQNSEE